MLSGIHYATTVNIVEPGNVAPGIMLLFDAQNRRLAFLLQHLRPFDDGEQRGFKPFHQGLSQLRFLLC